MESSHSELCKHENERDQNMLKNSFSALLEYVNDKQSVEEPRGYTLTEPVAVPMASNRRAGSQAKAVGLCGNPCCTVWNKIKIYYYNRILTSYGNDTLNKWKKKKISNRW